MRMCNHWPVSVCSWSFQEGLETVANHMQALDIGCVNLALLPALQDGGAAYLDFTKRQDWTISATMINFPCEDYSTLESIKATGGLALDTPQAKEVVNTCVDSVLRNPDALLLLSTIKNKDDYTAQHSLNVAILSVCLGRHFGLEHNQLVELGLCGLLHDVGKLVLACEKPELYREISALASHEALTMSHAELSVLGTTHTEIGAYLLGLWGLPNEVILAIARHHDLRKETPGEVSPASIIHVADVLELELANNKPRVDSHGLDIKALKRIGIDGCLESWRETAAGIMAAESP